MKTILESFVSPDSIVAKSVTTMLLLIPVLLQMIEIIAATPLLTTNEKVIWFTVAACLKVLSNFTSKEGQKTTIKTTDIEPVKKDSEHGN